MEYLEGSKSRLTREFLGLSGDEDPGVAGEESILYLLQASDIQFYDAPNKDRRGTLQSAPSIAVPNE